MRVIWLKAGAVFDERRNSTPRAPGDEDDLPTGLAQCLIAVQKVRRTRPRGPAPVAEVLDIQED